MTKTRKFSRSKKSTVIKVSNKNYNRQVKAGKIKPKNNRFSKVTRNDPVPKAKQNSDSNSANDSSSEDELKENTFSSVSLQKRKMEEDEGEGPMDYEQIPRNNFMKKKMRYLLPLKDDSGLIPQVVEVKDYALSTEDDKPMILEQAPLPIFSEPPKQLSIVELCGIREKKITEFKEKIGVMCSSVVENPEENLRMLKDVLLLVDINDPDVYLTVRKLACLSVVEVFKDILPTYKIRSSSVKEQGKKLKKETRQLREYESSLLRYYKQFLCKLEKMLECLKSKQKLDALDRFSEAKVKAKRVVANIAMKCFSDLLLAHPNFNFSTNILKIIVERMAHKSVDISSMCCETVEKFFKLDKVGEVSLEGVKLIKKLVKSRKFNIPAHVLHTFLCLNVKEADLTADSKDKSKKNKKQMQLMSRKEKKHQKKMQDLENELKEAEAVESKVKKSKFHTSILNEVFLIYFSILKGDYSLEVLAPVLEGLAKFSHLINVEFFDDLIQVMYKLLESDKLAYTETLHCLKSVFTILSGQGDSLNIDPQGFYTHLYKCLLDVNITLSDDNVILLLQCIDLMIIQRKKKITSQRIFAFLKRLSTISLSQSSHVTLSLLSLIRQLFLNFKQCDILLDAENVGSGQYNPDLEDPEYCHAGSTVLWELHQFVDSHHPLISKYAKHLLLRCPTQGQGQLHPFLTLKKPSEILRQFSQERTIVSSLTHQKGNSSKCNFAKKLHSCVVDENSITSQGLRTAHKMESK